MQFIDARSSAEVLPSLSTPIARIAQQHEWLDLMLAAPGDLLVPQRFDVAIKAGYVRAKLHQVEGAYWRDAYLAHQMAFNGLVEADGSGKLGSKDFLESFDLLIDDISQHGLKADTVLPVDENGVLLDGSHRAAVCLALKLPVPVVRLPGPTVCYDSRFFSNRHLRDDVLLSGTSEYVDAMPSTRLAFVWPTAGGQGRRLREILNEYAGIVAEREIRLSMLGASRLMTEVYRDEPWLGSDADGYVGAANKAKLCFRGDGPLRIFTIQISEHGVPEELVECKERIRELFGREKHSVHIGDTHEEARRLAGMLFNDNSIAFLNRPAAPRRPWFETLFRHYDRWLTSLGTDRALSYCIDGSAVLAAYGLRDARDLDFITTDSKAPDSGFKEISCHNAEARFFPESLERLLNDPRHHFLLRGRKVLSLNVIRSMKARRGEEKDQRDVEAIDRYLSGVVVPSRWRSSARYWVKPSYIKGRVKLVALKGRFYLTLLRRWLRKRAHRAAR